MTNNPDEALVKQVADLVPKWREIESAPKDGTVILLADLYGVGSGRWHLNDWSADWGNYYEINPEATHWMPLPLPPSSEEN